MNSPLVKALGVTLFHFLWEGLAIALVVAVCRAPARTRYRVACAALLAMPVAFFVTLFCVMPESGARFPVLTTLTFPPAAGESGAMPGTGSLLERIQAAMRWFVPFWIAGMSLFYLRTMTAWFAAQRLRREGAVAASAFWQNRLAQLASRLGVTQAVTLLESRLTDVPVVAGFLRPVILLPAGLLTGLPVEQLEYLLLHELAHIRRFDYAMNLAQKAIEGLLFYHPAVWWVSGVLREEREHCCDDIVLRNGAEAGNYARLLETLERSRPQLAMAATGGSLATRIRRILKKPETPRMTALPLLSTALVALCLTAVFVTAQTPATPYQKWVDEDVVYIIRKEERAAFQALRTDEEREKFIEQFWQRRDPTPGTPANEFKEEHYRRIAYAAAHFGGWKTDRARIYITFGPPDEIDAHPALEQWMYRHLDGIGDNVKIDFEDRDHNGNFRMTMDPNPPKR